MCLRLCVWGPEGGICSFFVFYSYGHHFYSIFVFGYRNHRFTVEKQLIIYCKNIDTPHPVYCPKCISLLFLSKRLIKCITWSPSPCTARDKPFLTVVDWFMAIKRSYSSVAARDIDISIATKKVGFTVTQQHSCGFLTPYCFINIHWRFLLLKLKLYFPTIMRPVWRTICMIRIRTASEQL